MEQEKELLEGFRKLKPESKNFIMSTVITAFTAESAVKRQFRFVLENIPAQEINTKYGINIQKLMSGAI